MNNINLKQLGKSFLLIILFFIIIPQIIVLIFYPFIDINNATMIMNINILAYVISIILSFIIFRKTIIKEWINYKKNFKKYFKIAFKYWGKGFLLMIMFNLIIISINGSMAANENQNRELLNNLPIFSMICMVILGPILEEIIFRKNFKEAFKNKTYFLVFTSLIFGLAHVISNLDYSSIQAFLASSKELLFILPYATLGYFFGKAYYETDCIFTSIMAHMFHNGLSVALILLASLIS